MIRMLESSLKCAIFNADSLTEQEVRVYQQKSRLQCAQGLVEGNRQEIVHKILQSVTGRGTEGKRILICASKREQQSGNF